MAIEPYAWSILLVSGGREFVENIADVTEPSCLVSWRNGNFQIPEWIVDLCAYSGLLMIEVR